MIKTVPGGVVKIKMPTAVLDSVIPEERPIILVTVELVPGEGKFFAGVYKVMVNNLYSGAGEIAYMLRALTAFSRCLEFPATNGDSQPFIMRSDALS